MSPSSWVLVPLDSSRGDGALRTGHPLRVAFVTAEHSPGEQEGSMVQ